jgi:hypothetical protein
MRIRPAGLALALLAAAGCRGPRPWVVSSTQRPAAGGRLIIEAVIENAGGGEGQVAVEVTLRSKGTVVERVEREVTMRPHERLTVLVPVHVATEGSYQAEVTARYPIH